MSTNIGYPVATVFNQSGTYTSDQNTNGVDSRIGIHGASSAVVSYWVMGQA